MNPTKTGVLTTEFWIALAALAGKIVAFLVTIKAVQTTDPAQLSAVLSNVILGIGTIWGLTHGSNAYVASRTALKIQATATMAPPPMATVVDCRVPQRPGARR